jgi:hypothetical protein
MKSEQQATRGATPKKLQYSQKSDRKSTQNQELRFKPEIDKNSKRLAEQGRERLRMRVNMVDQRKSIDQQEEFASGQQREKTPDRVFIKRSTSVYE